MRQGVMGVVILVASVGALACGVGLAPRRTATPQPLLSPTAGQGGIASGSASGPATIGLAPPARPASVVAAPGAVAPVGTDGTCPGSHPIKVSPDIRAYTPNSPGYAGIRPIACYAT